jgi:hypothetical protein
LRPCGPYNRRLTTDVMAGGTLTSSSSGFGLNQSHISFIFRCRGIVRGGA